MRGVLRKLGELVQDVAYGINAGNAIRHGLPAPEQPRRPGGQPRIVEVTATNGPNVVVMRRPPSRGRAATGTARWRQDQRR